MGDISWIPLESNPDVMTKFLRNLGLTKSHAMVDVIGLDKEIQFGVPQPVSSLLLLFPPGDKHEAFCKQQDLDVKANGQTVSEKVYFLRQTIKNACGTVALIHAVANSSIELESGSALQNFLDTTKDLSSEEKGAALEKTKAIYDALEVSSQEGQTRAPAADEDVNYHFIAFVHVDGDLYELDGRRSFPINHGKTSPETLLEDASEVCKQFVARDPDSVHFVLMALAPDEA